MENTSLRTFEASKYSSRLKIIIRNLPYNLTEHLFQCLEPISKLLQQPKLYEWFYFVQGSNANALSTTIQNTRVPSVCYIRFVNKENLYDFVDSFEGYVRKIVNLKNFDNLDARVASAIQTIQQHYQQQIESQQIFSQDSSSILDINSVPFPIQIEYAPYQRTPFPDRGNDDPRHGTIETDTDYLEFLKNLDKPVEKLLPADKQLEMQEDLEREKGINQKIIITPLMEAIQEKNLKKMEKAAHKESKAEAKKNYQAQYRESKHQHHKNAKYKGEEYYYNYKEKDRNKHYYTEAPNSFTTENNASAQQVDSGQDVNSTASTAPHGGTGAKKHHHYHKGYKKYYT